MKFVLEEPFKSLWANGYLVMDNEGRRRVVLYNNANDISGVTYARYLMCVKLGYILPTELEVDHIDNDKTNDVISNLQVLTKEENRLKQHWYFTMCQQEHYGLYCANCHTPFLLTQRELNNRIHRGVEYPFCTRSCAASFNHFLRLTEQNT